MSRFLPDTRNLGGRHLVSKIITNHRKLKSRILSSHSITVSPSLSRSQNYSSLMQNNDEKKSVLLNRKLSTDCYKPETFDSPIMKNNEGKKTVLLNRKLSTDCYKPDTFELSKKLSRNKKKRKNFQELKHEDELRILRKKMRKMKFSWFSISEFVLNA